MSTKRTPALRLDLNTSESGEYFTFHAKVVEKVQYGGEPPEPRSFDQWSGRGNPFTGIALSGQRDRTRDARDPQEGAYALSIGLATGWNDILPVSAIGKSVTTLRRAEKRLGEVYAIEGNATTFAQWFGRCAVALGIREVWTFRYGVGEWMTVPEAVEFLRVKEQEFIASCHPKEEVVTY